MPARTRPVDRGPFRADQLRSGDPYELSHGHAIYCAPTGGSGSEPNRLGASVLGWDPAVKEAGVDTGYTIEPGTLRAPDVAIGNVPNRPGWVAGVPELAVEYADVGQDEEKLKEKIRDLLEGGTRYLWVVRLTGPRRVEVHEPGKKMQTVLPGAQLTAPGVLQNPVRVEALYDRGEAERSTLTNLLQRRGYADLDAVLAAGIERGLEKGLEQGLEKGLEQGLEKGLEQGLEKGLEQGLEKGLEKGLREGRVAALLAMLDARGIRVGKAARERITACSDLAQLDRWIRRSVVVGKAAELFEEPRS